MKRKKMYRCIDSKIQKRERERERERERDAFRCFIPPPLPPSLPHLSQHSLFEAQVLGQDP
ncbi:MAG: hypothetical protein VXV85_07745, partial [Candidatus Thermoplasmatota archaeon]|nr:hypothetical protein [Candidatus Thermoplasmatota archaeon]